MNSNFVETENDNDKDNSIEIKPKKDIACQ